MQNEIDLRTLLDKEIEKRKIVAVAAAKKAGRILLSHFGRKISIKTKGDRDYATEMDLRSEKLITTMIRKYFPGDNILAEENKYSSSDSSYKWIIDPLDGTHNYMYGIRDFGISIALAKNNEIILGVIYMPLNNEAFSAIKGNGAYLNARKISVSKRPLRRSTMVYDSRIRLHKKTMMRNLGLLSEKVFNIRMYGSSVRGLTYLAQGKVDVVLEYDEKIWDCAAGLIIVEEAGGIITDLKGNKWGINTRQYVAANPVIHKDILKIVKKPK
ncbi:MAG: inositol monophosphatase [Elusimicrobia bacterium]|nr:inositol monophosphatase [Candidatus Liberimonas magnetica]